MEENRIPKRVLCTNLETTRPRGRPRNRWQDEVREDGSIVGGEEWQEKVYDREEWNGKNSIKEEIRLRIQAGNRSLFANKKTPDKQGPQCCQ